MSRTTRIYAGVGLLLTVTVESGGYFLFRILQGEQSIASDSIQFALFRAGHAHAGVLAILALIAMIYIEHTAYGERMRHLVRVLFIAAPLLLSAGFFVSGGLAENGKPGTAVVLYVGALTLSAALVSLAVGLIRKPA